MIGRNEYSSPPRGVHVIMWLGLGMLVLEGAMSIERFLLPEAVADKWFIGAG